MLQLAKLAGAATVIVSELVASKREKAKKLGAGYTVNPLEKTPFELLEEKGIREINVTIECVGRKKTMLDAFKYIGNGGHVLLFGLTEPDCEIPVKPYEIFQKEIFLAGGLLGGLVGRLGVNGTTGSIVKGAKGAVDGALVIGLARAIQVIMTQGGLIDPIINFFSKSLGGLSSWLAAIGIFVVTLLADGLIHSGSAANIIPNNVGNVGDSAHI